jgi:hypothetical protein
MAGVGCGEMGGGGWDVPVAIGAATAKAAKPRKAATMEKFMIAFGWYLVIWKGFKKIKLVEVVRKKSPGDKGMWRVWWK